MGESVAPGRPDSAWRRAKLGAYGLVFFLLLGVKYLLYFFVYRWWGQLAFAALFLLAAAFVWRRRTPAAAEEMPEGRKTYDRRVRAVFYGLPALALFTAWTVFSALCVGASSSKSGEVLEYFSFFSNIYILGLTVIGASALLAGERREDLKAKPFIPAALALAGGSAAYWAVVIALLRTFNNSSPVTFGVAAAFYTAAGVFLLRRLTGRLCFGRARLERRWLAAGCALVLALGLYGFIQRDVWLVQPYINSVADLSRDGNRIDYDEETGVYTITRGEGDFRILQLTDIHLGGSVSSYTDDLRALKTCYALIEYTRPDLVVVTGDLCFPLGLASLSLNNTAPVMQFAAFMRNVGIPWAFTYGNHDTEAMAASDKSELNELYKTLSYKTSKTLLYPYVQPDIPGRNNQLIQIRNGDGTLNAALFLLDSNAYVGRGFHKYDYIRDEQVAWYRDQTQRLNAAAGRTVPSYVFFHIPLQEYETAYKLYQQGSDQVRYFFGENNEGEICASDYPSRLFDTAEELGSTRGFFCGHDHYNNMSLEYRGIRLTYGMSIDYLVMPGIAAKTAQRGGTLIVLDRDGEMELSQIPYTAIADGK